MADVAVNCVINYLHDVLEVFPNVLEVLGGVVVDDGNSPNVLEVLRDLRLINILLENSAEKRNEQIVELVSQIRDVAYEVEDILDTVLILDVDESKKSVVSRLPASRLLLCNIQLHKVSKKIKDLKKEINKIYDSREKYGIARVEASADAAKEAVYERRRSEDEEDDVVGFQDESTILVKQLIEGNLQLDVVSIIGTGGSGKTTLARKIYNNVVIKSLFNCRAWVCISQNFRTRELLLEILKSAEMPKSDELTRKKRFKCLSEDELKRKLFRCLQGRRYLIVIEDICKPEQWDEVSSIFPRNFNGSRILITSRIKKVALHASLTPPHFLRFLNKDESWELFNKKVFRGETCPPELEALGRKVVENCCGLPLSIVVLGGFLAFEKKKYQTWSKLIGSVIWCQANTICKDILALIYIHLPLRLKPCFLYFGVYPEGFEIPVRQLIQLWIAERLIQHINNRDPEDVAEEYLDELIDRGLIQVARRRTDGGVKTCHVHDILRDFCISKSAEEKFFEVCTNVNLNLLSVNKSRRLSIQGSIDPYISSNPSHPSRSLLFLGQHTYGFDPNHWKWVLENFKFLRMLNFGCVDLYSIPTRIEELIYLRYLGIESDALKAIPASICKLDRLETLDFRGTFLNCLPEGVWNLPHLRNLYMSGPVSVPKPRKGDRLESLQVLSTVSLLHRSSRILKVSKLGLWFPSDKSKREVLNVLKLIYDLHRLQTLKIINCSKYHCLLMSLLFPSKLSKITLRHVRLKVRCDMILLGKLHSLKILKLQSCLLCSKLHICVDGHPQLSVPWSPFPQLEVLKLEDLRIKNWKQCRGAMPCLKHLVIKQCSELTMLPSNRLSLTTLRNVEVLWSSPEAAKLLQELQVKAGFKLLIYPPLTDDLHEKPAAK
ncbi:putative disease resistance RPP13-like protein 3 [Corylus avellana]|uniref:putative disease resistance RPP13-like protein 3 n=1 Tax=Corylus avellana TaxID=13451 RepID=UPI00286CEA28|nr:putative disease resistance RPP13-like protein 3 [Corylus avellana]